MNPLIAGAMGGFLATVPMTATMARLFQALPEHEQYPLPPREITEDVIERLSPASGPLSDKPLIGLSLAAHFAYGAATGALLPLIIGRTRHPLVAGGGYGLAVWAASYVGWLPAAKILRPATEHPARRNALMLLSHWVWGASTAAVTVALTSRGASPRSRGTVRPRL